MTELFKETSMEKQEKKFGKREIVLIAVIAVIMLLLFFVNRTLYSAPAAIVEISIINENSEKQVLKTLNLAEDQEYTIETPPDGINHLIIKDGKAWISTANCPNHDCVKKGAISENGEMLVCIPHRLTVSILGK